MTLADLHSWWTLALLVTFVGIVIWAFSSRRRKDFEQAARIPLDDDEPAVSGHERRTESKEHRDG